MTDEGPRPSHSSQEEEEVLNENSRISDASKQRLKDAVVYFQHLLEAENLISREISPIISEEAMQIGEEIYKNTIDMLANKNFVSEEELIMVDEPDEERLFADVTGDNEDSSDEIEPEEKKQRADVIPLEYKMKVVNMAKAHPTWNLKSLQTKGCSKLKNMSYLARWEEQIKKGGTVQEKLEVIDKWTYDRFKEARENLVSDNKKFTTMGSCCNKPI